jgi:ATP-dependent RNA helicase HelY
VPRDRAFPFPLDPFQEQALDALDRGASVLVSAPTGAGKTVVAEYAVDLARAAGTRAFYTTPLKALSNQKFGQLRERYGLSEVGLLTGDTTFQPDAGVVVMTTEVLRNMLFANAPQLADLGLVVLDEVHFLQDPSRGSVWEEVIILSPPQVRLVCLSATVANAEELGAWLRSVRGALEVVVEERRPVALRHHLAVAERGSGRIELVPVVKDGGLHPEAARFDQRVARSARQPGGVRRSRLVTPRRTELVEELAEREMLPAIVFIFSRAACEDAVAQCLSEGLRLTGPGERAEIRRRCEQATEGLPDDELAALGYGEWLAGLEEGLAAHHAGMIPAFREAVESCFSDGLLGVVFATETLSLGINMPARTVVVERLTKVRESGRSALTSGEYAQLTGRAGRRGLDPVGHAVVPWTPQVLAADVARLATTPPPDLRSSFRPTYNLAVNLVRRFPPDQARLVLDRSFAQWVDRRQHRALTDRLNRTWSLLDAWGYLDRQAWQLTPRGETLARIYHEADLLVAEALACGCLRGLDAAQLAGVASALVYAPRTARRRLRPAPPPAAIKERIEELGELAERLREDEASHRLPLTRLPDPGFAAAATAWARGGSLERILERAELAPGDFVRTTRQLVDLLRQLAVVADDPSVADGAAAAARALDRGVVASGVLSLEEVGPVEEDPITQGGPGAP